MAITSFLISVPSNFWRKLSIIWNLLMKNNIKDLKGMRDILFKIQGSEKTFEHEENLPSLPVPNLKETLDKYLDTVRAVTTDQEYERTEKLVREFENSEMAKLLQEKLQEKAKNSKNWLEKWWEQVAYLQLRIPLIPFSNMTGPQGEFPFWPHQKGSRCERMGLVIHTHLTFWQLVRSEQLTPFSPKGSKWSMEQFKKIFNTCRVPGETQDFLLTSFRTESEGPPGPTNIIVLYRGYIFSIEAFHEDQLLNPNEFCNQLKFIENWCREQPNDGPGIGALTVNDRTTWAKNRQYLRSLSQDNTKFIDLIENSLMVVSFSDSEPVEQEEILKEAMFNNSENLWADKSFTSIGYENGMMAGNADHTPLDGFAIATLFHYFTLTVNDCNGKYSGSDAKSDLPEPVHLLFEVDEKIRNEIEMAKLVHHKSSENIEVIFRVFTKYGRSVSAKHRLHPEAYFQMALQLTYYRLHNKAAPTYCTASTRNYYHGRTETCRPCFTEAVQFAKACVQQDQSLEELYVLLQKACHKFQKVMTEACSGNGCDRHLLGLYLTALENGIEIPELFKDESYVKSGGNGNFVLSTSCVGYWQICGSVPAMRQDGYSCFYGIENHQYSITLSCFENCPETSAVKFYDELENSLMQMKNILDSH